MEIVFDPNNSVKKRLWFISKILDRSIPGCLTVHMYLFNIGCINLHRITTLNLVVKCTCHNNIKIILFQNFGRHCTVFQGICIIQ